MRDYIRRNYVLVFSDMVLFQNAMTFLSINAVIPYFLSTLGASTFEASIASALVSIGTLVSQPFFAKKAMQSSNKKIDFVKILSTQRFFLLAFVLVLPFFASSNPRLTVILFLVCWGIYNLFVGSYSPFYFSLLSKMVPEHMRGRMIGFGGAAANFIALGTTYIVGMLLKSIAFPLNYTIVFGLGTFLLLLDVVDFVLMKEPPDIQTGEVTNNFQYIRFIPEIVKNNKKFVKMVAGNSFFVIANASLAYYALYSIRGYGAKTDEIAVFMVLGVIFNFIGNVVFGLVADKFNHRRVLQIASACGILSGLVILAIHSIFALYLAFILSSLCACGFMLSSGILIINNSPQNQIPVYIGINGISTLVVSSLMTLLCGFLADAVSFTSVYILTGTAALCAFAVYSFFYDSGKWVTFTKPSRKTGSIENH